MATHTVQLSAREREVALKLARDLTYAEIGETCEPPISAATVRIHVAHIARKIEQAEGEDEEGYEPLPPRWRVREWVRSSAL